MRKRLLPEAAYYTNKNKLHSIWRKFVRFMACIVVFCTTYALILPAITMEKTRCGIEEHTHSESCYAKQTQRQITMPACTVDSLGVHTHTEACYDADGGLLCGYADFLVHEHDASCMDESGELLCRLPEVKLHTHTEACYRTEEAPSDEAAGPVLVCTIGEEPASPYLCGLEEHTHEEACQDENGELVCGLEEHIHFERCTDPNVHIYCWLSEHRHSEACLDGNGALICGQDEHIHEAGCCDYIGALVVMIDTLPTSEEAEAVLLAYEGAGDMDGYAAYRQKIADLALPLYEAYQELEDEEKALVTNYDHLMETQWLWSQVPYVSTGSVYYPMDNGEWITDVSKSNEYYNYVHVNEAVPDEYTVDGLILGEKLADSCTVSFNPVFSESLEGRTAEECVALTGYTWNALNSAGLDNTYGANVILPADAEARKAFVDGKKNYVIYYNVGTYDSKQVDLLVQITNYKVFEDDVKGAQDGIVGFYSNGYIGIAVCGVSWIKLQYNFIDHQNIESAISAIENGESIKRMTVRGSTSFYDVDYAQAVQLYGSANTPWTKMLMGIYVTNVPSPDPGPDPDHQPEVPDLDYVNSLKKTGDVSRADMMRNYFREWPENDCVLKIGSVSNWAGPVIYSPHPYDAADEDWRSNSKHGFTATFDHTWFYMNYSFDKGRNADGGIRHFGEPVSRGSLTIKKEVEEFSPDPEKEYQFQITFYKQKSDGTYVEDTSLEGTYGGVSFTNGIGKFALKNGDSVTINNIPIRQRGTRYRVEELNHDGYHVKVSMSSQKVGENPVTAGPQVAAYYENALQADSLMIQPQKVTFKNIRNSISVVKKLTSTTGVSMVGDPEFSFQIMKGDANGNRTDAVLYGEGVSYNVYDAATGELLRENQTTEQYGIFKIKAGERAEFTGISEEIGNYYIREVLEKKFIAQYDSYYVDGVQATVVEIPNFSTHSGVVSAVKSLYDGGTVFTFENRVKTEKLSYLTITKMVNGVSSEVEKTLEFDMRVELNGTLNGTEGWKPIPAGTPYTLYQTDAFMNNGQKVEIENEPHRFVKTEGIVTVPGGATAEIDYMIPGTTWRVYETSGSAAGYTVGYGEFWGEEWITAYDDRVEGTIPVYNESNLKTAHVCMTVTNTLPTGSVSIPATKTLYNGSSDPNTPHTYRFTIKLESVMDYKTGDYYREDQYAPYESTKEVQVSGSDPKNFNFVISYSAGDFPKGKTTILTYSIKENKPDELESTHDTVEYTAVVVVTRASNGSLSPAPYLYSLTKNGQSVTSAMFTNILLGDLTLEKQVDGGTVSQENGSFDFKLELGTDGTTPLPNWTVQVIRNDGAPETMTTDSSGVISLTGIKHGDRVQLRGIPLGCVWRITETNADGYVVSWTANESSGNGNIATGGIPAGGMEVVFVNQCFYELSETGGAGTYLYTMGGLLLIAAAAILLYIHNPKRRKEDMPSF